MSARTFIQHGDELFRFVRFNESTDGSLVLSLPREIPNNSDHNRWDHDSQSFVPVTPNIGKRQYVTFHTSGRVNYHDFVSTCPLYFEPLFDISDRNFFFFISMPSISRLDRLAKMPPAKAGVAQGALEIPSAISGRVDFRVIIAPRHDNGKGLEPNIRIDYDMYSVFVAFLPTVVGLPEKFRHHFIYGAPPGIQEGQRCGMLEAEIAFHQRRTGQSDIIIYPPDNDGVYTLYAERVMRAQPDLRIRFSDPTLHFEVIRQGSRSNRLRFRVIGKAGIIRDKDLRSLIISIVLDAEL